MSSALCLTFVIALTFPLINGKDISSCHGKHSIWDKWYDGCNWCVCTENGPVCTNKSCSRIPVDRCDPVGEKWRDGCYRCQCTESGISCYADHRCVHAMRYSPVRCDINLGCICGIDGVPSCLADTDSIWNIFQSIKKRQGWKYFTNEPHPSKDRYDALMEEMSCTKTRRWYAGTKRCFCEDGSEKPPLCGDPRHISHRIDGYRFKVAQCYSNQEWSYNCKRCKCHMYGFGFCVRIPSCRRGSSLVDRRLPLRPECQPNSRWREGCKDCSCTSDGRRFCVDSDCNASGNIAETKVTVKLPGFGKMAETRVTINMPKVLEVFEDGSETDKSLPGAVHETKLKSNPRFQIPPTNFFHMFRRFRPRIKKPEILEIRCEGKYRPGDKFYRKCNYCECTGNGDSICTAILCV